MKAVSVLADKSLIAAERSCWFNEAGLKRNGNNVYTILPTRAAVEDAHQRLIANNPAKGCALPLAEGTVAVLKEQQKKAGESPWVFPSPTGGPMSPHGVLHMLHRVLGRAGLPHIRFHDLRHTFATLALQNGVDIKTVSGMLGHYSAGFTLDTYTHTTTPTQREAANTMANVLGGMAVKVRAG